MYVLRIGKARPEWIIPEISGTSPSPRYGHTMDYYPGMKMIAIFGVGMRIALMQNLHLIQIIFRF